MFVELCPEIQCGAECLPHVSDEGVFSIKELQITKFQNAIQQLIHPVVPCFT